MKAPIFSNPLELATGLSYREEMPPVEEREHVEKERFREGKKLHDAGAAFAAKVSY